MTERITDADGTPLFDLSRATFAAWMDVLKWQSRWPWRWWSDPRKAPGYPAFAAARDRSEKALARFLRTPE